LRMTEQRNKLLQSQLDAAHQEIRDLKKKMR
jgi:hypothetical protein